MADESADPSPPAPPAPHQPPAPAQTTATWTAGGRTIDYTARAEWTVLRTREKPTAEIFSIAYLADRDADGDPDPGRPLTFVFNGGPGASSAFLHLGAIGPQRVAFPSDGSLPRPPARLVPNEESWLSFTDLVFVDPVGTGFSRVIQDGEAKKRKEPGDDHDEAHVYFGYKRDLESLCEFIGRWLSVHRRWGAPVFIAGESYGGYRVGRLARMLQEETGVGLNGVVLISPALELASLLPTDYDVLGWVDLLPTMALAAAHHGRSRAFGHDAPGDLIRAEAEEFATGEYATLLTRGAAAPAAQREQVLARLTELIGLPAELVARAEGRVSIATFTRELLRDERRVLGRYDATITVTDPFPDRDPFAGPDPTLTGIDSTYTTAINRLLRGDIGVDTDREYVVLSEEVNGLWRNDAPEHFLVPPAGATDDLRYGMALNPHLRAFICHGRYDLVTPYHASDRLRDLMRLDPETTGRLTVRHFNGGHMFYAWESSRRELAAAIAAFVAEAQ